MSNNVNYESSDGSAESNAALKAQLRAEISRLNGIIEDLEEEKAAIEKNQTEINDNVSTPLNEYDLSGEGVDWQGANYKKAEDLKTDIDNNLLYYDSSVDVVLGEIQVAINKINDRIQELEDELSRL